MNQRKKPSLCPCQALAHLHIADKSEAASLDSEISLPIRSHLFHILYISLSFLLFLNFDIEIYFSRFNSLKGYGFIVPDDGSQDIFVHQTEIQTDGFRSLADGEPVEYETVTESSGKTKATKVTGPDGAQVQGAPFRPQEQEEEW